MSSPKQRFRVCAGCSQKYFHTGQPDDKFLTTPKCDADLHLCDFTNYVTGRPYIVTGYHGAYDSGYPLFFKNILTLKQLKTLYPQMHPGCDICDNCLHQMAPRLITRSTDDPDMLVPLLSLKPT